MPYATRGVSAMTGSFAQLNSLLHEVWPAVSKIDWTAYGEKIVAYDETGVPKCTGIIAHFASSEPVVGQQTQVCGFLPRPEKSAQTVVRKVRLLQENKQHSASLELRNPSQGDWGGAVRSEVTPGQICAVSGLPEIGDHLLVLEMMRCLGMLPREGYYLHGVNSHSSIVKNACKDVGMIDVQFCDLHRLLADIVNDSSSRLGYI